MRRPLCLMAVLLASLWCAAAARAAERPEVVVQASASEVFTGESFDYYVEIRHVPDPNPPDLSGFARDFEVRANGDESRNQSSTTIINGKVFQENVLSHVYRYRLTPRRAGQLEIPAPDVTVEGQSVPARTLSVTVRAPEQQDLVIAEIQVDRRRVYPTQPFEVTLRVLVQPLPGDDTSDPLGPLRRQPPHIEVNWVDPPAGLSGDDKPRWLQALLSENGVGFTLNEITMRGGGFFDGPRAAVLDLARGRELHTALDGREVRYFVYELRRRLIPDKAARHVFGPALVKGTFVSGEEGSKFQGRKLVTMAPSVEVEVRDVPEPRPPTFCGGIGAYRVSASASPRDVRVGDPVTLTLEIERSPGSGALDLISAPDLAASTDITTEFEILDRNPTGRVDGEVKRFAYALRPRRAGVSLPALPVTVFDPDAETFTELLTRPIEMTVTEAVQLQAGELVGVQGPAGGHVVRSREQGIFQNVMDPAEVRDQSVNPVLLAGIAAGTWMAAGGCVLVVSRRRRTAGDPRRQRRQQARRTAEQRLAEARTAQQSVERLRLIRTALCGLVADLRNIVGAGMTAADTDMQLEAAHVPAELRLAVRQVLEAVDAAEYGAGTAGNTADLIDQAADLVSRLAPLLERGQ